MKLLNPPSQASSITYLLLLAASLSASKFVLSTLGFQFPMVFQVCI